MEADMKDIMYIIDKCVVDFDDRKVWCQPEIMNTLLLCITKDIPKAKEIMTKLFCFTGKTFKCSLCLGRSTSPKRWPVSMIKKCGHRFHTKCIKKHMEKHPEWQNDCAQSWALHYQLTCPNCREPFQEEDIITDQLVSEVCQFDSEDET